MPLPTPNLDDRTFEQLVAEARARIPRYTPEWTNFNDADPGMTLVKLHAWMTETILYRLNRLPDLNYIKFLELLNIQPRPATPAKAQLTFTLKKLNNPTDPLVVLIPKNTQVGVNDPDLTEPLIFETDRTLTALNAILATIIVPADGDSPLELVTEYDPDKVEVKIQRPFYPFGETPVLDAVCLLGIMLRPNRKKAQDYSLDRFPAGELDLTALIPQVFEVDAAGNLLTGPESLECLFPWQVADQSRGIVWEAYTGTEHASFPHDDANWTALSAHDDTALLTRSDHIYLETPGGLPAIDFYDLPRAFWLELEGRKKPPTNDAELIADLNGPDAFLDPADLDWEALGLPDAEVDNIAALIEQINSTELDYTALDDKAWQKAGYDVSPVPYELVWFRARLVDLPDEPPQVSAFLLNTAPAAAAVTRVEEIVGASDGRPNQQFSLRRRPLLVDAHTLQPELTLEIEELGQPETWQAVSDFYGAGPDAAVFLVDSANSTLTFGDGVHGRIPVAGAQIVARSYRYGGGAVGNAGAGTISALKSALPNVDKVTNVRAAAGGADAETLAEVMLRAPHDLRMRDRAVTGDDFAQLAQQTPGVPIQRAYALPLTRLVPDTNPPEFETDVAGAVTVVILPQNKEDTPQPTGDQLRLVCAHLNQRRLITTELYVVGPRYLKIKLDAEVVVSRDKDLKAVKDALVAVLLAYFHPLRGGEDGQGWPFGEDIYLGNVYRQVLTVAGVRRVVCLAIAPAAAVPEPECEDMITVPDGTLVYLPASSITLDVRYDDR